MILSQATKGSLLTLAFDMGLESIVKGLKKKTRANLIEVITKRACTSEEYMKMITPEPKDEPVIVKSKVKCAKYTFEFTNGSKATAVFRKEADESWTIMRTSTRLNWMLQPKRTWDREWTADDKTPRTLIKEEPRPWEDIRKFVFNHKHEVETFTIDA